MKKILLICLIGFFSLNVFAQSAWQITWDFYGIRHQALLLLDDDNTGIIRVQCYNIYYGTLIDIVDQDVVARKVSDGVIINCYRPRSASGSLSYSADNFKIFNNGAMYMKDDNGNWSTQITMYEVNAYYLPGMLRRYGFD